MNDPEGDWLPEPPHELPPPVVTVLDAAAEAVMRELPDISQIDAIRAARAALGELSRLIVTGGKEEK